MKYSSLFELKIPELVIFILFLKMNGFKLTVVIRSEAFVAVLDGQVTVEQEET